MSKLHDKIAILNVIGNLMKNPSLIMEKSYDLDVRHWESFHKVIYSCIHNLAKNGANYLTPMDIDAYLSHYEKKYKSFCDNRGFEYLEECCDKTNPANADYYLQRVKKFLVLADYRNSGIDISDIYDEDIMDIKLREEMLDKFDNMTVEDICDIIDAKTSEIRNKNLMEKTPQIQAGDGLKDYMMSLKNSPEWGVPGDSRIMNTITRGMIKKKFYLRSSPTGGGKTRFATGDASAVSIRWFYDKKKKEWIDKGWEEPTLIITTELGVRDIQTMIVAYVSGVQESKMREGTCTPEEEERWLFAVEAIEKAPLYIVQLPNFTIGQIEAKIKEFKYKHKIGYVFFDYMFVSIKMLMELAQASKGMKMREDTVLYMFSERMKTLANDLDVFIYSSTQLNGEWKNVKEADQNLLRGAKSIADKIDVGSILLDVTKKDLEMIDPIIKQGFFNIPNSVLHIYKVRAGKLSRVKLWLKVDKGTCRTTDCFLTDNDYELIPLEVVDILPHMEKDNVEVEEILSKHEQDIDEVEEFDLEFTEEETTEEQTGEDAPINKYSMDNLFNNNQNDNNTDDTDEDYYAEF